MGGFTHRLSLVLYVLLYNVPVPPLADCGHIESIGSELAFPEIFLELWKSLEELLGRDAFEYSDNLRGAQ